MLYQVYNESIKFFPSLELKPLTPSASQDEVVKAMQSLLGIVRKLQFSLSAETRATCETYYEYLNMHKELDEAALMQTFDVIYLAFMKDLDKQPKPINLSPGPKWHFKTPNPFKYNHMDSPVASTSTLQDYRDSSSNQEKYRVLFHQYIALEKRHNTWVNTQKGLKLQNELPHKRSGSAEELFPHLLDFAKNVNFSALEFHMSGIEKEALEMATGIILTLSSTNLESEVYSALLEYAQALEIPLNRIDRDFNKKYN